MPNICVSLNTEYIYGHKSFHFVSKVHVESELTIVLSLQGIKHHYADNAMQRIYCFEASAVENHL